jgi:hypothetical protein
MEVISVSHLNICCYVEEWRFLGCYAVWLL